MPASKAQQKAVNKYMAANYDRINLTVPKGKKAEIQIYADANGESVNGFINKAIDQRISGNADKGTQNATETHTVREAILTPETLQKAREAAQNAGESVPAFIGRAVDTQAQRDKMTQAMFKTAPQKADEEK